MARRSFDMCAQAVALAAALIADDAVAQAALQSVTPTASARGHRVAIVLFDDAVLLELVGPARILDAVPGFTTYTVAATRAVVTTDQATIVPDYTFADAPAPDVIIVSSGSGGLHDRELREWLRREGPRAQAVLSVCNGALLFANAGLLDGRGATCPAGNLDGLMLLGKEVRAYRDRRVVRDGHIVTCDSYFAGVDGALEVVRFLCGEAAAQGAAARNFYEWKPREADPVRAGASPTPASHQLAVLRAIVEGGPDAGFAAWREWTKSAALGTAALRSPTSERMGFHILGWTLEGAGRNDEAIALCEWTAAAFPDSALALACVGEAYFQAGRFEEALAPLLEADAKEPGEPRALEFLAALLHHPDAVANDDWQRARQILRAHAADSSAALAPPEEPGERMVIRGVVRDTAGRPVAGALLHVFQADASGRYTPGAPMDEPNARLFAFLRTDEEGRYDFTTVRPGGYPQPRADVSADTGDERWIPQHIHYEVEALGHIARRLQLTFRDDPRMTPHWQQWAKEGGNPVVALERDGAGTLRATCDIVLR